MLSVLAQAAQAAPDAGSASPFAALGSSPLPLIAVMFAIFYFMLIRPQQKAQQKTKLFLDGLKKGDEVVTTGGVIGRIDRVADGGVLVIEVANNVKLRVLKAQVAGPFVPQDAPAAAAEGEARK